MMEIANQDEAALAEPIIEPRFPKLRISACWIILFVAMQVIIGLVAVMVSAGYNDMLGEISKNPSLLSTEVSLLALPTIWGLTISNLILVTLLWFYLRRGDRIAAVKLDRWSRFDIGRTLLLSAAVVAIGLLFNYVYATYIFPDVEMQEQLKKLIAAIPKTAFNNVLLFFAIAILAPVLEELLFRGLLQNSLMQKMPAYAAILLSGVIFAAVHMDPIAFLPLMVLGAAFGYLYHATGSLRVCIAIHVINNAAAMLLS